ncbi:MULTISPECIES: transposase [Aneurinibacillus]|jgi:transposase-like protein|uniref:Transposase n=1 Tax=Aneurinibacillus thermoaerophilus TaxID=143495 RepID=A0A1G8EZY1_ANETH|nr:MULTISPECIES: transposase [Aneurinibacillus]MED0677574.1 transposase [Aneurinibacillus thermoaerophilus]MED0680606.1 transposase [Aneurinibacillus thermoaerophilus]MED0738926.1 transposase [Aneurinibacillus thermoaerophilus]MED0758592.1 transposase [Aneurinibacillus thermoaerophilus]MED0762364.1 transposase [Aneurinibacillus thermoaerophilus]
MKRQYSIQFKHQVVKEALEVESLSIVARRHRLNSRIIYRWVREFKEGKYSLAQNK